MIEWENVKDMSDPKYMVCPDCHGEGHHTLHGAAITADEMAEQGPEFQEDYMSGVYDTKCVTCKGEKVILTADLEQYHLDQEDAHTRWMESGCPQ